MNKRKKESLATKAYNQIKQKIITLEFRPGMKLEEKDLAVTIGLGRTPIREAIKMLVSEGLVINYGSNSTYVKDFSLKASKDLMTLLYHLGNIILDLASVNGDFDPEIRGQLEELYEKMDEDVKKRDYLKFVEHNSSFHKALAKIANNEYLDLFIDRLYNEEIRLSFILSGEKVNLTPTRQHYEKMQTQHRELIGLLKKRDFEALKASYHSHLKEGQKRLIDYFNP